MKDKKAEDGDDAIRTGFLIAAVELVVLYPFYKACSVVRGVKNKILGEKLKDPDDEIK